MTITLILCLSLSPALNDSRKEPENPVPNGFPIDNHTEREVLYIEPPGYDINSHSNRSSSLVCRDD